MRHPHNCCLLIVLGLLLGLAEGLVPTAPVLASPNTESSPSNFIFSFKLGHDLPATGYLMVVLPFFSVTITPKSCTLLSQLSLSADSCHNLNTASNTSPNPITINTTTVNSLNPNIASTVTIVVGFSGALLANTDYSLQILLQDNLPAIGALSESFQMYAMSGTGVMLEENWNMGQVFLELRNNNLLNLVSINAQNANQPGITVSTLLLDITIGVASPTALSTFLFTISGNFQFTASSLVTTIAVTGDPPAVQSTTVVSPNLIKVIFSEQLVVGRHFRLTISNVYNPVEISSGALSLYSLPYNSITPLQIRELFIPYQTVSYTPTLSVFNAEGLSPFAPMQFYMNTVQYVTLQVVLPRIMDSNFVFQLKSDVLYFQQGTAYFKTSTVNSNTLVYAYPDSQTLQISGFTSNIPSGSTLTLTFSSWIGTSPIFNLYVSIDTAAHITAAAPIIYGTTSGTVSVVPELFVAGLTGTGGQTNKITAMQTTTSSIMFSVTPLFQTFSGSYLELYTRKDLAADVSFSGSTSCLVNATAQPCTLTTNSQYTVLKIASNSSFNLFQQSTTTTIQINQLKFNYASSHSEFIYHFYFQLTVSLASLATVKKQLMLPMVVQQRSQLTNFNLYFSNNIYNSGSNFLNVIRLVSSDPTQWNNVLQVNERRVISIFAHEGWTNLFSLTSYSAYPCASNLAATYTYIQGSNTQNLTIQYPLNWDRINIVLPGTESSTKFSIIIPTLYPSTSPYSFEVLVGVLDTNNGAIRYLQAGPMPTSGASTYLTPVNILVYSKPKQAAMQLNIAGLAGAYKNNVNFTIAPSGSFNGNSYSSAVIVLSSWQFYVGSSALASTSLGSADPQFANVEQTPLTIKISSTSYLTYIPFKTTGVYSSNFNIVLDNIKFPYSLDLPYHSVSLIDSTGSLDGYNEFINQNQNIFYTGVLQDLTFSCNDNSLGVINTFCTIGFTSFQDIEVGSVLVAHLFGLFVSTDLCSMQYTNGTTIPIASCTPNVNQNVLTITLANTAQLPASTPYSIVVNGMSIDATQISNYLTFKVMDPTNAYTIEEKTKILMTSVAQDFPIEVAQFSFAKTNPVVPSSLFLNFTLPRTLNADEAFALVLNKDFITPNSIPSKMNIRLLMADGLTLVPTTWVLKSINSQIIFQNLQSVLTASTYSLELYGITTPSTVAQDMITLIYLRIYDNTYANRNTASSTATFPALTAKVDSLITLQTYFNTEGLEQELLFTVINQFIPITQYTVWVVNLPIYYSQTIWNDDYLIYCTISGTPITCARSTHTPYQIIISDSPLLVAVGPSTTYTLSIYGIPCPRATYLNGNSMFATESIFLGMFESSASTLYADYSNLYLSNTVIDPQSQVGYGWVVLEGVSSSNMQVYQTTFFTIDLTCSVAIPTGSWIFITFPQGFDNFNNIPIVVQTQYAVGSYEVSTSSSVINRRVGYQLNSISIPASTRFQVMITSLLTPTTASTIDMNTMRVLVASSDRLSTLATSLQSRNQLGSLTFVPNSLHLTVNNYYPIQLTAGTYSNPIRIAPSDNSTFLTNMQISFSSTQFSFNSNPTFLYLGDAFSTVIIGTGQNVIPTTYTFNLAKKETAISALYSTLSEYPVQVTSLPITVVFPASFSVPLGGCSLPVAVSLTNAPFSYITIYYEYNTTQAPPSQFWVNQEISYEQMSFDINNTQRWVSFCTSNTFALSSLPITLNLGGDNAASYTFSQATTTINVVSNTSLTLAPTFSVTASNVQKTFATLQVTTNVPGFFFYELQISPLSSPLSFSSIQTYVKGNSMTLQANTDFLTTRIYTKDRDHRVGYEPMLLGGTNFLNIENLLPERGYTLCGYFQNQFHQVSQQACASFTMQSWGVISKAYVEFSSPILANQLNNLLCFFVKASSSQINQVVDLQGSSCSLNTSPQNYFYAFTGNTTSQEYTRTVIYHTADLNLTSDPSISAFRSLFDANGITSAALSTAQTDFSINFISSSYFISTFEPMVAMQASAGQFQPTITFTLGDYVAGNFLVTVSNLMASSPAIVYFVLVSYKNITTNQITSTTNITIRPLVIPSEEQVASCLDGSNYPAIQCRRVVLLSGMTYSFNFDNLAQNSVYAMHYTYANQYPQRPVFYGGVHTQYIFTTNHQPHLTLLLALVLLLLLMIL